MTNFSESSAPHTITMSVIILKLSTEHVIIVTTLTKSNPELKHKSKCWVVLTSRKMFLQLFKGIIPIYSSLALYVVMLMLYLPK